MTRARGFQILGVTLIVLAAWLILHNTEGPSPPSEKEKIVVSPAEAFRHASRPSRAASGSELAELPEPTASPDTLESPKTQDWIDSQIAELESLAWFDDSESLRKILAELRSSNPEIRAAALAATRAFGSRDAVPYLQQAALGTSDPAENQAIIEAINYLQLPTFLEENPEPPRE